MLPTSWKPRYATPLIRIGSGSDGGYVIAQSSIEASDLLISFGLNDDWGFEEDFRKRSGADILCFDHTVTWGFWARRGIEQIKDMLMGRGLPRRFWHAIEYRRFFDGRSVRHVKSMIGYDTAHSKSLRSILAEVKGDAIFLKIDIEGWEYRILDDIVANAGRLSGLAMELHDVDLHRQRVSDFVTALSPHLDLVHVHANNAGGTDPAGDPLLLEMSFARLDAETRQELPAERLYPVPELDAANLTARPDIPLVFS